MNEMAFERRFREWIAAEGMRMEAVVYPRPEAGGETHAFRLSPAGQPRGRVLVTHGAGNDALFGFVALFRALLGRGYELFTFDMDGHGRHGTTRLSAEGMRSAVGAALHRAGYAGSGPPVHGVGLSFGGSVLLRAMADDVGGRFASAVLMVTPTQIRFSWRGMLAEAGPRGLATLLRERRHYGWTGLIPSFGPFKRGAYPLRLAAPAPGPFGYVDALNELLAGMDLPGAAERVRVPVLLVYGARDRLVPPVQGERLHRALPRSALRILPRETHLTTPLSGEAVRACVAWLHRQDGGSA